jgi:hypothetical protein
MDSRCKFCGEPFDLDEFHENDWPWDQWVKAFRNFGCGAVDALFDGGIPSESCRCKNEPLFDDEKLEGIGLINELLGDDTDGACTMIEDLF